MEKLFPSGLAEGQAFCNRVAEKTQLKQNIENTVHTLIISPRRYGKTSLVLEAFRSTQVPYAYIQFFNALRDELLVKRFLKGFSDLLSHLITPSGRALKKLAQFLSSGKLVLKAQGLEIGFGIEPLGNDPIEIIQRILSDIERILKNQKKRAVIFLDEFQDIVNSDLSNELQSILRDFIQRTHYITFIISGSHRHMLTKLFDDRNKPFYKLFERMTLKRINEAHYERFLKKLSLVNWKKELSKESIHTIFQVTECHAYYFNRLCQKLWALKQVPQSEEVYRSWNMLVEEEFGTVAVELSALTKNQRIVLQLISRYKSLKAPTGNEFLNEAKLPHRSVLIAIEALEELAFVERVGGGYQLVDPMIKYILNYDENR